MKTDSLFDAIFGLIFTDHPPYPTNYRSLERLGYCCSYGIDWLRSTAWKIGPKISLVFASSIYRVMRSLYKDKFAGLRHIFSSLKPCDAVRRLSRLNLCYY